MRRADIAMYNAKWQRPGVEPTTATRRPAHTGAALDAGGPALGDRERRARRRSTNPSSISSPARIVGAEALVRWEHPSRGRRRARGVRPVRRGHRIDQGAHRSRAGPAHRQLRTFDEHGLDLGLAVNLSTHDLFDSRCPSASSATSTAMASRRHASTLEITGVVAVRPTPTGAPRARRGCTRSACGWRSTTSAPATRRSRTFAISPWTSSNWTGHSPSAWSMKRRPRDRPRRHRPRAHPRSPGDRGRRRDTGRMGRPQRTRMRRSPGLLHRTTRRRRNDHRAAARCRSRHQGCVSNDAGEANR